MDHDDKIRSKRSDKIRPLLVSVLGCGHEVRQGRGGVARSGSDRMRMGCQEKSEGRVLGVSFACGFSEVALPAVLAKPRYREWDENGSAVWLRPHANGIPREAGRASLGLLIRVRLQRSRATANGTRM